MKNKIFQTNNPSPYKSAWGLKWNKNEYNYETRN